MQFFDALRHAAFQVGSIITTTGYATVNFDAWSQDLPGNSCPFDVCGSLCRKYWWRNKSISFYCYGKDND